jgi:hypothetical protein
VVLALIVCALVACAAADSIAIALATIVGLVTNCVHEHLEQAQPVMQVVKLGMDVRDEWLSEFGERVFEVYDESQCDFNHNVRDHVRWNVFATCCFATSVNALPVLVDLGALNLLHTNDHFAMVANVLQQCQNG